MIKILFLDFDGTISDAYSISFKSLVRTLDDYGYEFDKSKLLNLMGDKMQTILEGLDLDTENLGAVRRRFYKYFTKEALDGGIRPCVSLKPLWKLKKDCLLIVVSNSETHFLKASIKKLGIKGLFDKVYGAEKFRKKDEMLKKLFKKFKIKSSEAIYIGDRFSDIRSARSAGCISVAIQNKCSWSDLKTIKKEKPDYIIRDFRELKKLVGKLNRIK